MTWLELKNKLVFVLIIDPILSNLCFGYNTVVYLHIFIIHLHMFDIYFQTEYNNTYMSYLYFERNAVVYLHILTCICIYLTYIYIYLTYICRLNATVALTVPPTSAVHTVKMPTYSVYYYPWQGHKLTASQWEAKVISATQGHRKLHLPARALEITPACHLWGNPMVSALRQGNNHM